MTVVSIAIVASHIDWRVYMDKVSKGLAQGFSAHSQKVGWGRTGVFFFLMFATAAIPFSPVDAANFSSWQYNRTFTIAAPGTGSAVTNFPVMVRLNGKGSNSGNATDSLIFATALSNGGDIRFSNTGTTDSIPFEIQRYDAKSMVAIFWVLVPSVASGSTNTTFKMYWGNAGLTGTPSNPNAVFARGASGNGFESVYHLREATGTTITDATANGYAMTANGTITQNAGVNPGTDSSEAFDGSTGYYSGTSPNATFRYILRYRAGSMTLPAAVPATVEVCLVKAPPAGHREKSRFTSEMGAQMTGPPVAA